MASHQNLNADQELPWDQAPEGIKAVRHEIHSLLKQANFDFDKYQFNTVASACMKMLNALEKNYEAIVTAQQANYGWKLMQESLAILLRLLSPITPHICDELWRELGYGEAVLDAPWPQPEEAALEQEEIELVVQVNGKLRGRVQVAADAGKEDIQSRALANDNVARFIDGKDIKKVIVVPGRLVNIVVA